MLRQFEQHHVGAQHLQQHQRQHAQRQRRGSRTREFHRDPQVSLHLRIINPARSRFDHRRRTQSTARLEQFGDHRLTMLIERDAFQARCQLRSFCEQYAGEHGERDVECVQRHAVEDVGEQREHREEDDSTQQMDQGQQPLQSQPGAEQQDLGRASPAPDGHHCQGDQHGAVVEEQTQSALPAVLREHRFRQQPRRVGEQHDGGSQCEQDDRGERQAACCSVVLCLVSGQQQVGEQQCSEIDAAGRVDRSHRDHAHREQQVMAAPPLSYRPHQHEQPEHESDLAGDGRVSRIVRLGEQRWSEPHAQQRGRPRSPLVRRARQPPQECQEGQLPDQMNGARRG